MNYYSKLKYISKTKMSFLPGKDFKMKDLMKQGFEIQTEGENFWYQFDYRRYSIKYIFAKDFASALCLASVIQYVNLKYISFFDRQKFATLNYVDQYNYIQTDLEQYQQLNNLAFILSFFSIYSL